MPDPALPNYRMLLSWMGARHVPYPCPPELGFQPDLERLASLITRRTRLLVVNSPNNPTGAVYPREVLEELADLAVRNGLWLLSDECYDQLVFGPEVCWPSRTEAFYIMADVALPSSEAAVRLLEQPRVAVAPGTAFGAVAADAVRITLANSERDLREGVARLSQFVAETRLA